MQQKQLCIMESNLLTQSGDVETFILSKTFHIVTHNWCFAQSRHRGLIKLTHKIIHHSKLINDEPKY